jgi:zinc finger HIT domain-containing protein 1
MRFSHARPLSDVQIIDSKQRITTTMYHIEVLPSGKDNLQPGYAYVPDTGYDPSKAAIVPSGSRKRARLAHQPSTSASTDPNKISQLSARQASKIAKHLADLDRENHKDVQIVVPNKSKDIGVKGITGAKREKPMTLGVKKILQSQKTWGNYLDDEEAALALQGSGTGQLRVETGSLARPSGRGPGRERDIERNKRRRKSYLQSAESVDDVSEASVLEGDAMEMDHIEGVIAKMDLDAGAKSRNMPPPSIPATSGVPVQPSPVRNELDDDPLLRSRVPPLPTQAAIQALLAMAPLSYNVSKAAPTTSTAPPRRFCEMCGYWGRVSCVKCGVRICGLECSKAHEETRCLKFYA